MNHEELKLTNTSTLFKTEEEMWANRLETKERLNKFKK